MTNDTELQTIDDICVATLITNLETEYTCLRPPRPSGALLHCKIGVLVYGGVRPASGSPTCKDEGQCMIVDGHCVRNIHAEVRAILVAARAGYFTEGSTLYSWNKPCYNCTMTAIEAGVTRIVYVHTVYDEERTKLVIERAGIVCEQYTGTLK